MIRDKNNYKWHKRVVKFDGVSLRIYRKSDLDRPIEEIWLPKAFQVIPLTNDEANRFILSIGQFTKYEFSAPTKEDLNCWLKILTLSPNPNESLKMDDFEIISVIGRGYYGKVMLSRKKKTNQLYAIKSISKRKLQDISSYGAVINERNMLMKVRHPFIVQLYFTFQSESKFYFGLEYAGGGELFYHMQQRGLFDTVTVRLYAAEIILALEHMHSLGVIYRDLKPENILLDTDGHIKLTDFGLAKEIINQQATTFCGTKEYLAPEIILGEPYSSSVDVWALGVLVYELLFGDTPFYDENQAVMFDMICNAQFPVFDGVDERLVQFFERTLEKDPRKRATIEELKGLPIFAGINWDMVYNRMYQPEFLPKGSDPLKPQGFDPVFTEEVAADSFASPPEDGTGNIPGFSFVQSQLSME